MQPNPGRGYPGQGQQAGAAGSNGYGTPYGQQNASSGGGGSSSTASMAWQQQQEQQPQQQHGYAAPPPAAAAFRAGFPPAAFSDPTSNAVGGFGGPASSRSNGPVPGLPGQQPPAGPGSPSLGVAGRRPPGEPLYAKQPISLQPSAAQVSYVRPGAYDGHDDGVTPAPAPTLLPSPQQPPPCLETAIGAGGVGGATAGGMRTMPFGTGAPPSGPPSSSSGYGGGAPPISGYGGGGPPTFRYGNGQPVARGHGVGPPPPSSGYGAGLSPPPQHVQQQQPGMFGARGGGAFGTAQVPLPPPPTEEQASQQLAAAGTAAGVAVAAGIAAPAPGRYDPYATARLMDSTGIAGMGGGGAPPRIDPAQVPRPTVSADGGADGRRVASYFTCTPDGLAPRPPATSRFRAVDEGTCSPRFIRPTLGQIPLTKDALAACGVPLAAFVQPMAAPEEGEPAVPLVDFGDAGPPRCTRCRGYINAHARFLTGGERWECNLCGMPNQVPVPYRCGLDAAGLRRDRAQRPELCRGSVDFAVPAEYSVRPLQEPVFVFVVDASAAALESGFTTACLGAVDAALDALPGGDRVRAGVVTFDASLHFYWDPKRGTGTTAAAAAGDGNAVANGVAGDDNDDDEAGGGVALAAAVDVEDPFCPLPAEVWVRHLRVGDNLRRLRRLLERIPAMLASRAGRGPSDGLSAAGAALQAVADGLAGVGGRIFLMAQGPPLAGVGALPSSRLAAARKEREGGGGGGGGFVGSGGSGDGGSFAGAGTGSSVASGAAGLASTLTGGLMAAAPTPAAAAAAAAAALWQPCGQVSKDKAEASAGAFWKKLGETCASRQIAVDLLVAGCGAGGLGSPFADVATLSQAATATGGQTFWVGGPTPPGWGGAGGGDGLNFGGAVAEEARRALFSQLALAVARDTALEAVLKVRCSGGIAVTAYLGQGVENVPGELETAAVPADASVACLLTHDGGKLREGDMVCMQAALLYTSVDGRRLVRCHTLALRATGIVPSLYRSADAGAIVALAARQAAAAALRGSEPLAKAVGGAIDCLLKALLQYRRSVSPDAPMGQLILPESLRLLPLYALGLSKSVGLRQPGEPERAMGGGGGGGPGSGRFTPPDPPPDERAAVLLSWCTCSVRHLLRSLHPSLYSILDAATADATSSLAAAADPAGDGAAGVEGDSNSGGAKVGDDAYPTVPPLPASAEQLSTEGVFLLDSGTALYIYVGANAPPGVLLELCGRENLPLHGEDPGDGSHGLSLSSGGALAQCVLDTAERLRRRAPVYKPLYFVLLCDAGSSESRFISLLVEDQTKQGKSYVQYLCWIHEQIRTKLQQ
ncbi:unnamed protein product [Phaeothamnion confervicola]